MAPRDLHYFDPSEFGEDIEAQPPVLQSPQSRPTSVASSSFDEEAEDDLDLEADVEQRLEVASIYRAFMSMSVLFDVDTPAARMVHRSLKSFAKTELKRLIGLRAEPEASPIFPKGQFTEEEARVLKGWAAKLISRETGGSAAPGVVQVQTQPQTRTIPVSTVQVTKPPPQQKDVTRRQTKTKAAQQPPKPRPDGVISEKVVEGDDLVRTIRKRGRIIQEQVSKGGRLIVQNDRTPQVTSPLATPLPMGDQITAVSQQLAVANVLAMGATPTISAKED